MTTFDILFAVAQIAAAFAGIGAATYTAGLFAMLCNTLVLFFVLVQSLLQPYAPDLPQPAPAPEPSAD